MNGDRFELLIRPTIETINNVNDALAVTGLFYLSKLCFNVNLTIFRFLKTHLLPKINFLSSSKLNDIYGGDWAVVTGSSEGIGKAYAEELAKRGMNIVLISNDVGTLQQSAIGINERYKVEVAFISLTFDGDANKYDRIKEALCDKTIGILVNNVGVMYDYPQMFLDVSSERLWQLINVNIAATTMMTYMILPQMVERKKGAIINVSAGACSKPSPLMTVYSGTKAYIDLFSRSLDYEYRNLGITVQCLMPFYVATRMQRFNKSLSRPTLLIPTAQEYAKHAIQTLEYSSRTTGYWPHTVLAYFAWLMPEWLWIWGATRLHNALKRQAQEKHRSRSMRNFSESIS